MKYLGATAVSFALIAFGQARAGDKCPIAVGDMVTPISPKAAYESLSKAVPTKGEFETTAEFEARKRNALQSSSINGTMIIRAAFDRSKVHYDADNSRFVIETYAWDNLATKSEKVFGYKNKYGIRATDFYDRDIGLGSVEKPIKTYEASSAFGAKATVVAVEETRYSIFDRPGSYQDRDKHPDWVVDAKLPVGEYGDSPIIFVAASRDVAPTLKKALNGHIVIRPKEPFTATGKDYFSPTINVPKEVDETINIIVGDILCAVITDPTEKALRTIDVGY